MVHLRQSTFGENQRFAASGTGRFIKGCDNGDVFALFGNRKFFPPEQNTVNNFGKLRLGFCQGIYLLHRCDLLAYIL